MDEATARQRMSMFGYSKRDQDHFIDRMCMRANLHKETKHVQTKQEE